MKGSLIKIAKQGLLPSLILSFIAVALLVSAQAPPQQPPESTIQPPETIHYPSPVGQVDFPHQMHIEDLGMDCSDCHHPIKAPSLETPHPQYFEESTIKCQTCHHPQQDHQPAQQKCSECHDSEEVIPHHQLSSKVAIHGLCSGCHEIGTGQDASSSCSFCHSGPKSAW